VNAFILAVAEVVPAPSVDIWGLLWTFANSAIGITIVSAVVLFFLGRMFTSKPEWQKVFDQYRPLFFDAIRYAEKAIPDGSENTSARRADEALKFILKLEPKLAKSSPEDVQKGLAEAHAEKLG